MDRQRPAPALGPSASQLRALPAGAWTKVLIEAAGPTFPEEPPRAPSGEQVTWGPRQLLIALGLAVPGIIVAFLLPTLAVLGLHQLGVIHSLSGSVFLSWFNFVTTVAFYGVLLAIVLFFAGRRAGRAWTRLGLRRFPIWVVVLMPPGALLLQIVSSLISLALSPALGGMKNPQDCDISQAFGAEPLLAVLSVAVIAPVVEEIVFRGFIYGGLKPRLGVAISVLVSSALFALAHSLSVGGSILLLAPSLFVAGVALALVYERSRSLVPGMVLHGSFNLLALAAIFLVKVHGCP